MPSWPYIKDIELADPEFNRSSQVDILFGADVYAQIMMSGILRGENLSQPIAQQTRFGWILCGKLKSYQCNIILNNTEDLQKFWEIEDIEESPSVVSSEDQYCLYLYKKTTLRQANGRKQGFGDWVLPHHCVTREHSETTKLRVVFNGSAKTSTGLSLNDVMYPVYNL
ncbi:unnamed protein product [Pieris brassicae]|uniref:Peptidase aspartic putative domain-containing protein n=1 Tax=Pieris brassicae TaxID=7116 RepID=A0A9P0XJN9_PIEBR|nr:unnamed protein product [Pieris brassicae]